MIQLSDVWVGFGGRQVLCGINLEVATGRWCALIGPNGAGKSTLLRALAGRRPDQGKAQLDGEDIARLSPRARARRIAVVEQEPVRPAGMNVTDYVTLGRTPYVAYFGREGRDDRLVVAACLDRLDLGAFAHRDVATLSGGEWQRAVIARALAQRPRVLLLDEPTSALDIGRQLHVLELVRGLQDDNELTVISATHDLSLAAAFSDDVALMSDGRIVAHGTAKEVITEDVLGEHYGARLRVLRDDEGHLAVVPRRMPS